MKLTLPEEGLTIWLDKEKSEIVLYNILSNALKFTPENGVISVALEYDNNASRALIIIKDSGVGIREDKKNQIFDRFFSTSDERFKGTGIGLSLAKEFVELHGGRIEVESIVDVGSCFTIIFPTNLAPAEGRENMSENPEENYLDNKEIAHSTVPVSKDRKFYTLLIVEDNEDLASFMKNQLSKDYSILTASNGREALDIIGKQPNINIIVSDIMMPLINGFELCKRIKSDISTSHLPVILLTAINSEEYKLRGYEYLADAYITKPFSISELQIRIANLLRNRDKIKHLIANMGTINEIEKQSISDVDKDFLQRMFDLINSNYSDPQFDVSALAGKMAMSRSVLHVKMKAVTDVSPSELINKRRMNEAMEMIKDRKYALADIALACGFSSQSYFSKAFKKMYGESPSKYM